MAEFTQLGKHCAKIDCKQLDFLPFNCTYCASIYCKEHFPMTQHGCDKNADQALKRRPEAGVCFSCNVPKCPGKSSFEILCSECNTHFCLSHRHASQHACSTLEGFKEREEIRREKFEAPIRNFQQAKESIDKDLNAKLASSKNKERAAKIQLMRLKSKAHLTKRGLNIPSAERLHFLVRAPERVGKGESVVVVSSFWSVGRALDVAADYCRTPNNNNQANKPQLRLFYEDKSQVAENQMHETLGNLIEQKLLFNGQTLVLEYI